MRRSAKRLNHELAQSTKFLSSKLYTDRTLKQQHEAFYKEISDFRKVNPEKGYGRWLWKPFLIHDQINKLDSGTVLLYIDGGCHLNLTSDEAVLLLEEYKQMALDSGGLAMQLKPNEGGQGNLAEECYSSLDLMDRLNLPQGQRKTMQIQATLVFLKVGTKGKRFVKDWLNIAREENHKYLREDLIQRVTPNFRDYRWDQSIFSALYKQTEFTKIPDETWWGPNWREDGRCFPIWAMRHRSGAKPFDPGVQNLPDKILTRLNL